MNQHNTLVISEPSSSQIDYTHIYVVVDGYKIKMNFPASAAETAIIDAKKLMLCGVSKCAIS